VVDLGFVLFSWRTGRLLYAILDGLVEDEW
jgi:hypothetical protein